MGWRHRVSRASKFLSRRGLNEFIVSRLMLIPANARVLNVGSGGDIQALVEKYAKKIGFYIVSTDIDPTRNPHVVDDITQSSFPDDHFDAILIIEVLEHVIDPRRAAAEIQRLLKPGGSLVLSTPFIFPLHDRPHDFFRYTKYGLSHLFGDLESLEVRERNSWTEAALVLLVRATQEPKASFFSASLILTFAFALFPIALLVAKLMPTDFATTGYVLSGRKPSGKLD